MKNLLTLVLVLISLGAFSQGKVISKYFDQYADNEEYVKVSVSSKMFSLFTELEPESEEEKDFLEAVSKLKGLKIIAGDSVDNADTIYKTAVKDVQKAGYEELMTVKDAEENVHFAIMDEKGIISELIMVAGGKRRFVVLSLYGEIDLNNISKLGRTMNVDGLQNLKKLDDND